MPHKQAGSNPPQSGFMTVHVYGRAAEGFAFEVDLAIKLPNHRNIQSFIGFTDDLEHKAYWIISPWERNGNVREFLAEGKWGLPPRFSLVQDCLTGLKFLHTQNPPICHGRLTPRNILVNSSYRAVISDFTSARIQRKATKAEPRQTLVQEVGDAQPIRLGLSECGRYMDLTAPGHLLQWNAPELLSGGWPDLPADMWSLGWIVCEILTNGPKFDEDLSTVSDSLKTITWDLQGIQTVEEKTCIVDLCNAMSGCYVIDPTQRPTAPQCAGVVNSLLRMLPAGPPDGELQSGAQTRSCALLCHEGRMHLHNNQLDAAKSCFSRALGLASSLKENAATADASVELGLIKVHGNGTREDMNRAIYYFEKARSIYSSIGNSQGAADASYGLGAAYRRLQNCPKAEKALEEAGIIYSRLHNKRALAWTFYLLGEVYCDLGQSVLAFTPFKEALKLYDCLNDEPAIAETSFRLGQLHRQRDQKPSAAQCWIKAKDIYSTTGDKGRLAETSYCLGKLRKEQNKIKEASTLFEVALSNYKSQEDEEGIKKTQDALGEIDPSMKRLFKFEAEQRSARSASIHNGDPNRRESLYGGDSSAEPPEEITNIVWHANGGFGDVYSGQHRTLGIKVALKKPLLGPIKSDHDDIIRRFKREAAVWEPLEHPHLLKFLGTYEKQGTLYLVSPFVENGCAIEYVKDKPSCNRVKLLRETAAAVRYLHAKNLIHGDINGRNILISDSQSALLCDFGQTKEEHVITSAGQKRGSAPWMSPERLLGGSRTRESDVYAFGMTIAEILTGKPPFWPIFLKDDIKEAVITRRDRPLKSPISSDEGKSYESTWEVAERCWKNNCSLRISMATAFDHLRAADEAS
ncbi:hypothetical protein FS837_007424 [Tulasnella sp. UAMH 9824]|nr:hypothetical protein FS837_007424 [Tulasnella sp. UAMH 9824]